MTPPVKKLTWRARRAMKAETRAEIAAIVDPMLQTRRGAPERPATQLDKLRGRLALRRVIVQAVKAPTFAAVVGGLVLIGLGLLLTGYVAGRVAGALSRTRIEPLR